MTTLDHRDAPSRLLEQSTDRSIGLATFWWGADAYFEAITKWAGDAIAASPGNGFDRYQGVVPLAAENWVHPSTLAGPPRRSIEATLAACIGMNTTTFAFGYFTTRYFRQQ